ncbi:MAG: hypothetical protein NZ521_02170 [Flammeovirgaceae bacterium]|nr:hypothetical protein [Flammeovirgaceae bacterium]MDW8286931.1 hypothetical protein [Flammeovirgaceae bacterium]
MKKMYQYTRMMKSMVNVIILITFFGNWSNSDEHKKKNRKEEKKIEISLDSILDLFYNQVKMIIKG